MAGARTTSRAFLGVGWSFPVKPVGGRLQYAEYEDDVDQAIQILLLTERGERPMIPELGSGLRRFVFEPNSPKTHRAIEHAVQDALIDWEPRIDLRGVEATPSEEDPNMVLIHVDYTVRATNTHYNRVYPFYLLEGKA